MKSIMEEASSIIKAIEKGWIHAGKPQEFTVKVFEEATKNFMGISTKPAKIGIFFTEKTAQPVKASKYQAQQPQERAPRAQQPKKEYQQHSAPAREMQSRPTHEPRQEKKPQRDVWTPEMVAASEEWLKDVLKLMNKSQTHFTTEVKNYYLKVNFEASISQDQEKERFLFRNFAYLIMQSLRNKFKKSFRGFKIILSSPQ